MTKKTSCTLALLFLFAPLPALAQDVTDQLAYVYVTYFECDPATEARADEIIARTYAPHYDAAVEAGDILGWSWLAHYVGGKWRRALVINASDMDRLLESSGALGEILEENTPEAGRAFSETCPVHEDYIWQGSSDLAGVSGGSAGGNVRFSMYMHCDMSRESRADDLFREDIAPIYNAHVTNGELTGWAMLRHDVGGQWRRLLTIAGPDHKAIMRERTAIIAEMEQGRAGRSLRQINEICSLHQDYMWDVQIQSP